MARILHPATADFHSITGTTNIVDNDGNRVIHIDFDAKNSLGNELPYTGECIYTYKSDRVNVTIYNR